MATKGTSTRTSTSRETLHEDGKTFIKTVVKKTTTDVKGKETVTITESKEVATPEMIAELKAASEGASSGKKEKPQPMKEFREDVLKMHNHYRKLHGRVGDLKQNKDLDKQAQSWADELAKTGNLAHSEAKYKDETLGENLASRSGSGQLIDYQGKQLCEHWYKEASVHDFSKDHQKGSGHFSQMVWKGSKEIGVGKAFGKTSDGMDSVFVVVNYYPAGNYLTQYAENVMKKK